MTARRLYHVCLGMNRRPAMGPVLRAVRSALGADAAYVKLLGPDGGLRIGGHVGLRAGAFRDHVMRPDEGLGGYALRAGIVTCEDYFADDRFAHAFDDLVAAEGLRAAAVAPLPYRDGVLGLLYVAWRRPVRLHRFDVWRFGVLAAHAALAVREAAGPSPQPATGTAAGTGDALGGSRLTARQLEVLRLRSLGLTVAEIASRLGVSEHTVRFHLRRLMRRLHCHSEVALVAKAFRSGILS